jgi:hypothetical protein
VLHNPFEALALIEKKKSGVHVEQITGVSAARQGRVFQRVQVPLQ